MKLYNAPYCVFAKYESEYWKTNNIYTSLLMIVSCKMNTCLKVMLIGDTFQNWSHH